MKNIEYKLNIEKPCSQDWEAMKLDNNNRFCLHCQKTVIDFSNLSDIDISKILNGNSNNICGRLNQNQLNRPILPNSLKSNSSILQKAISGILFISAFVTHPTNAQNLNTVINQKIHRENYPLEITFKNKSKLDSLQYLIQGKIIDGETKEPLQSVNISILNSNISAITDIQGNFNMVVPDSLLSDSLTFNLRCLGYFTKSISIDVNDQCISNNPLIIGMEESMLGLIAVVFVKKKKWWQIWKKSSK